MLARYRDDYPDLKQLVLRVSTVLGANTNNLITNLFKGKRLLTVAGSAAPFVFIWDQDLLAIIEKGVRESREGIFNVAGDGTLTMKEIGALIHKPVLSVPAAVLKLALATGRALRLTRYGPAQLNFLRYRPVLANGHLREDFPFVPEKSSRDAFVYFADHARQRGAL